MEYKDRLKDIFSNVNEWLRFAEAKHAGLIVLNSGLIVGVLAAFSGINQFFYKVPVIIALTIFGISIFTSLLSQLPTTRSFVRKSSDLQSPNIYFYGHLSGMDSLQFLAEFRKSYPEAVLLEIDKNLVNQILINARITSTKYLLCKVATYLTTIALIFLSVSSLIKIIWDY